MPSAPGGGAWLPGSSRSYGRPGGPHYQAELPHSSILVPALPQRGATVNGRRDLERERRYPRSPVPRSPLWWLTNALHASHTNFIPRTRSFVLIFAAQTKRVALRGRADEGGANGNHRGQELRFSR